jgi:SAM-dependent methyltransferase
MRIPSWLAESDPQVPFEPLIEEINKIFHSFDATHYDREHPEIHQQLPPIWAEMIAQLPHVSSWNVLDFGCGTGFEADLLLSKIGDKVAKLTAYDPSAEMILLCKNRLQKYPQVTFCSRIEEAHRRGPFDMLLTNSLLHHLPNIVDTVGSLLPSLSNNAVWLAGHEPSARFYRNDKCLKLLEEYRRFRKYARWFDLRTYTTRLRLLLRGNPLSATAYIAHERGLFLKRPSPAIIDRIVDFHVPRSVDDVTNGHGLDIEKMQTWLQRDWILQWSKTYAFLSPVPYSRAPNSWVKRARQLELQYPSDGANFCMVWRRRSSSREVPSV